jgi:hypothetical protein
MKFPDEEVKKYWIFACLIDMLNRQEEINDNQDKQLWEIKKRLEKLEK